MALNFMFSKLAVDPLYTLLLAAATVSAKEGSRSLKAQKGSEGRPDWKRINVVNHLRNGTPSGSTRFRYDDRRQNKTDKPICPEFMASPKILSAWSAFGSVPNPAQFAKYS